MRQQRDDAVSLFQRIKSPFTDIEDDYPAPSHSRSHPVGDLLRDRREELGLNLDEIGEALRIRPTTWPPEQGRAQDLPGPTYAIRFIRARLPRFRYRTHPRRQGRVGGGHPPDLALPVPLGARSLPGGPILLVRLIWPWRLRHRGITSTGERSRARAGGGNTGGAASAAGRRRVFSCRRRAEPRPTVRLRAWGRLARFMPRRGSAAAAGRPALTRRSFCQEPAPPCRRPAPPAGFREPPRHQHPHPWHSACRHAPRPAMPVARQAPG
jgi:hypothetical protein